MRFSWCCTGLNEAHGTVWVGRDPQKTSFQLPCNEQGQCLLVNVTPQQGEKCSNPHLARGLNFQGAHATSHLHTVFKAPSPRSLPAEGELTSTPPPLPAQPIHDLSVPLLPQQLLWWVRDAHSVSQPSQSCCWHHPRCSKSQLVPAFGWQNQITSVSSTSTKNLAFLLHAGR